MAGLSRGISGLFTGNSSVIGYQTKEEYRQLAQNAAVCFAQNTVSGAVLPIGLRVLQITRFDRN